MSGFAASPGTDVEPTCSTRSARSAQGVADPRCLALEQLWPLRVVLGESDRRVVVREVADRRRADLLVGQRRWELGVFAHGRNG